MALFDNAIADMGGSSFNTANGVSQPGWSLLGGINGNNAANRRQYEQQKFNATQAQIGRNFNERMSNTAVQRRMADLKKAGINPILAGGYSASSPQASNASASLGQGNKGLGDVIKTFAQVVGSAAGLAKALK